MKKKRKKGAIYTPTIDIELDLHGCTAGEARDAVRALLHDARSHAWKRARIIVGKGMHSPHGPVLPDTVKACLTTEGYSYTYAKVHDGGEGALEVVLSK